MASLSSPGFSGLAPEQQESRPPRRRRYVITDESGAQPLPTDDDDAVEPPRVSQRRAGDFFGIGFGLGIAILAVLGGLYFGGYHVGRPALNPSPAASLLEPDLVPFQEAQKLEAIALARIAPAKLDEIAGVTLRTELNSPDIRVIEQTPAVPRKPSPEPTAPDPENPY